MGSMKIRSVKAPQTPDDFFPVELSDFSGGLVDSDIAVDTLNLFRVFQNVDYDKGGVNRISKRHGFTPLVATSWGASGVGGFGLFDTLNTDFDSRFKGVIVLSGSMKAANVSGTARWVFSDVGTIGNMGRWVFTTAMAGTNSYLMGCNQSYTYLVHWDGTTMGTISTGTLQFSTITYAYGRVFLSGAATAPVSIYFSDYEAPLTYDFTVGGLLYKNTDNLGGYIKHLAPHPQQITIIKETAIERFLGQSPDTFSNLGWEPSIGTELPQTAATYGQRTAFLNNNGVRLLTNNADSISTNMIATLTSIVTSSDEFRAAMTEEDYYLYCNGKVYLYNFIHNSWREYTLPGTTNTIYEIVYSDKMPGSKPVFVMKVDGLINIFQLGAALGATPTERFDTYNGGSSGIPVAVQWSDNIGGGTSSAGMSALWKKFNAIRIVANNSDVRLSFAVDSTDLTTPTSNKLIGVTPNKISDYDYVSALNRNFNGKTFTIKLYTPTTNMNVFTLDMVTVEGQGKGLQYK